MRKVLILFSFAFAMTCSYSCVSTKKAYDGPDQRRSKIAIVKTENIIDQKKRNYIEYNFTNLLNVDSSSLVTTSALLIKPAQCCEVLPGIHTFQINCANSYEQWNNKKANYNYDYLNYQLGIYQITFNTEAGKSYLICSYANHEKREIDVYVLDADTKERVESTVVEVERYKLKSKD